MNAAASYVRHTTIVGLVFIAVGALTGFFFRTVLAHQLSVAQYGMFFSAFSVVFLFQSFRDLGMGAALSRFVPLWQEQGRMDKVSIAVKNVLVFMLIFTFIVSVTIIFFRHWIAETFLESAGGASVLVVLALAALPQSVLTWSSWVVTAFKRADISTAIPNVEYIVILVATLIGLSAGFGVLAPAYAYLIAAGFMAPVLIFIVLKRVARGFQWTPPRAPGIFRELVGYGKFFIAAGIGAILLTHVDVLMLAYIRGTAEVGLYNAAWTIVNLVIAAGMLFSTMLMPLAASFAGQGKKRSLAIGMVTIYKFFFIVSLPFTGLLLVFPEQVITMIFGSAYIGSTAALRVFAVACIVFVLMQVNLGVLGGIGEARVQAHAYLLMGVFNIALNLVLIPLFGVTGAAIATACAYFIGLGITLLAIRNILDVHPLWKQWGLVLLSAGIGVGIAHAARYVLRAPPILEAAIVTFILGVSYLGMLALTRAVRLDELLQLWNLIVRLR